MQHETHETDLDYALPRVSLHTPEIFMILCKLFLYDVRVACSSHTDLLGLTILCGCTSFVTCDIIFGIDLRCFFR